MLHHSDPLQKRRRLGSPGQDQLPQTQHRLHRLHRHHQQSSPSPPATRNLITVFTHRSHNNNKSSSARTHDQPEPDDRRPSLTSTSPPSASDSSPRSADSHPLTPLSSTSASHYSTSHRTSSFTTPSSSTDSALPVASVSFSHHRSPTTCTPPRPTRSKAQFKMPFRDRVARRFGETVSSGSILDSVPVQDHESIMSHAFHPEQDESTRLCASPTHFLDADHVADHKSDPRLGASSGRSLSCARYSTALHHDTAHAGAPREEPKKFLGKALGQRQSRISKPAPKAMGRNGGSRRGTGSSTGVVQGPPTRSSSRRTRSSSSSSSNSTRSFTPASVYSNVRRLGARVTRASANLTDENDKPLTDLNGKQLSPTSPYLSCEYPRARSDLVLLCDIILLMLPTTTDFDVCCMRTASSCPPHLRRATGPTADLG